MHKDRNNKKMEPGACFGTIKTDRQTNRQNRQTDRQTDISKPFKDFYKDFNDPSKSIVSKLALGQLRQTDRQTDKQTEQTRRHTDKQTEQTDRQTYLNPSKIFIRTITTLQSQLSQSLLWDKSSRRREEEGDRRKSYNLHTDGGEEA